MGGLGAFLGRSWVVLEAVLGGLGSLLGRSWGGLGAILGRLGSLLGSLGSPLTVPAAS